MPLYLADSSIWIGRNRPGASHVNELLGRRLSRGEIATCVPVALEVLVGADDAAAYARDWLSVWQHLVWLPLRERATRRALEMQMELARLVPDGHRLAATSYLIAACAEDARQDVVLWHWDDGLSVICEHTGQAHEPEYERAHAHGFIG